MTDKYEGDNEPDNPEDILEKQISEAIGSHDENKKIGIMKELFEFRCNGYSKVKKELTESTDKFNERTKALDEQMKHLREEKDKVYSEIFKGKVDVLEEEQERLRLVIIDTFPKEVNSVNYEFGNFYLRGLKSVEVVNKDLLVKGLVEKGTISKAIKSFDNTWLKKAIELEIITSSQAKIVENKSLVFKPKEEEKHG